ncbi:TetR/AcrR family transcriptional regulator [Yinghuangia soli]|uniref:TetR family transcriptional regulator n=1 Tax=Yinghuangia soli TaxID=2908204 RepID=A0AA41U009_9ACTN|nr:TetR/AcrR family transcriptional regulator [Yinghuangia soli]MCF2527880.1 TetR family transcriptional regulator [Yinghuangia soli]
MVQNPERRAALLDAAISVLAAEGARGLTFRAVDAAAGVPKGTASNYFGRRDDLVNQIAPRIYARLGPDPDAVAKTLEAPPSREVVRQFMHELMARVTGDRVGYIALLELRLEATRRPELRAALTEMLQPEYEASISFHLGSGLPGDRTTVSVLYFAILGLIVEHLTTPGAVAADSLEVLVDGIVDRVVPAG